MRKVALVILSAAIEDLHRQLSYLTDLAGFGQWLRALDWCSNSRHGLQRLWGNPHLTDEERDLLRAGANDLTQIIQYIESNKRRENASANFSKKHREAIDRLVINLGNIQTRLGEKSWEV